METIERSGKQYESYYGNSPLYGYIFVADSLEFLLLRVRQMKSINSNAVSVFMLRQGSHTDLTVLLMASWINYKMLNAVGISVEEDEEHSLQITNKIKNPKIYVSYYDPFVIKFGVRGYVYGFHVDQHNISKIMKHIVHKIRNRFINLYRYPLRVCIFEFDGITSSVKSSNGTILYYTNLDGELLRLIQKRFNFQSVYIHPEANTNYGYKLNNNTLTGAYGILVRGEADIGANIRPVLHLDEDVPIQYLHPIDDIEFWFLTPNIEHLTDIPLYVYFCVFNINVSIVLACIYFGVVILWCCMEYFFHKYLYYASKSKYYSIEHTMFTFFGAFVMAAQNVNFDKNFERCIYIFFIFFATVLSTVYQGTMVKLLQETDIDLNINTLEELAESDLDIFTVLPFKDVLNTSGNDAVFQELFRRQEILFNPREMMRKVAIEKTAAALLLSPTAYVFYSSTISNKTGKSAYHLLKHGPSRRFRSHMIQKESPYEEAFNGFFRKVKESGLISYWRNKHYDGLIMKAAIRDSKLETADLKLFGMNTLIMIFQSYLILCSFCICVFIGEFILGNYIKPKHKKLYMIIVNNKDKFKTRSEFGRNLGYLTFRRKK